MQKNRQQRASPTPRDYCSKNKCLSKRHKYDEIIVFSPLSKMQEFFFLHETQVTLLPPSTAMVCPTTSDASTGEDRKAITRATSSGRPGRPIGWLFSALNQDNQESSRNRRESICSPLVEVLHRLLVHPRASEDVRFDDARVDGVDADALLDQVDGRAPGHLFG